MNRKQKDIVLAGDIGFNTEHAATNEYLHQYAEKVRSEEREACAKLCEESNDIGSSYGLAQAIRARGQA